MARKIINDKLLKEIKQSEGGDTEKEILKEIVELEISSGDLDVAMYDKIISENIK